MPLATRHFPREAITGACIVPGVKIPGGSKALMLIGCLPYLFSRSAKKAVEMQVRTGVKVQDCQVAHAAKLPPV
ncbi:hypothetical protein N7463_001647 [Penicillium fimorum]|uniref:Uncharacterized protein n=1 Tax=Penicillium fimorum TaxID=1882269 RepID=A0A9W9XYF2_9EURO|nr:hypothetical protein N7463_001647 [Penicillium fimorum]